MSTEVWELPDGSPALYSTYKPEKGVQPLGAQGPYPAATDLSLKPLTLYTSLGKACWDFEQTDNTATTRTDGHFEICE